jgi:hypothetical protein
MKLVVKSFIGKHLSYKFPIQNGIKQRDALKPLLFNFALKSAIRKTQENPLVYADDANLLGDSVDTIKKNSGTLIDAS